MRGVMEKCTYCIQRIEQTRIAAKREGDRANPRRRDPDRLPADLSGPGDRFRRPERRRTAACRSFRHLPRTYGMLDPELNTKPRTQYVAKVRNEKVKKNGRTYELDRQSVWIENSTTTPSRDPRRSVPP